MNELNAKYNKRLDILIDTPLCKTIDLIYDKIKESKSFDVYYLALHDLIYKLFEQEINFRLKNYYDGFVEECVEYFYICWSHKKFDLSSKYKDKKPFNTLSAKLIVDGIHSSINYFENKFKKQIEESVWYNQHIVSCLDNFKEYVDYSYLPLYDCLLDDCINRELDRIYEDKYFIEDELRHNISVFIAMFLSSFNIEYIASNDYYKLTNDDFHINMLKCKFDDSIKRIKRKVYG